MNRTIIYPFESYPAYKPFGVKWLGEVPEHWQVRKLRRTLRAVAARNRSDLPLLSVVREKGVMLRDVSNKDENHNFIPDDLTNYKVVQHGQFAMNKMKAWQGSYGVSKFDGIVSPAYFVFDLDSVDGNYFHTAIRSKAYVPYFTQASDGVRIGQWDLSLARMREIPFLVPPLPEQTAIGRYLDHADRRIRRYIDAKQKLVKLLEEQKQAIIHQAVTRGLDPNVCLKPSGVEWLGDVPEHWEVIPFKRRVGFQEGPGIMAADFRDSGVPLLRISCLRGKVATLDGCNYLDHEMVRARWGHFAVSEDDYLLSASANTGAVSLATSEVAGSIPYTGIIRLWPTSRRTVMAYVSLFMNSRLFQNQIDLAKSGVGIEHFGPTHLNRMVITLPPAPDQKAIVDAVKEATEPLAIVTDRSRRQIDLLREYRTRLIADVVTGKLDVREAAARLPDEVEEPEPLAEIDALTDVEDEPTDDLNAVPEEAEA